MIVTQVIMVLLCFDLSYVITNQHVIFLLILLLLCCFYCCKGVFLKISMKNC